MTSWVEQKIVMPSRCLMGIGLSGILLGMTAWVEQKIVMPSRCLMGFDFQEYYGTVSRQDGQSNAIKAHNCASLRRSIKIVV